VTKKRAKRRTPLSQVGLGGGGGEDDAAAGGGLLMGMRTGAKKIVGQDTGGGSARRAKAKGKVGALDIVLWVAALAALGYFLWNRFGS